VTFTNAFFLLTQNIRAEFTGVISKNGLVGPQYCAQKDARTQWTAGFSFAKTPAGYSMFLTAEVGVNTRFDVRNTDAMAQVINMESRGIIDFSGPIAVQSVAQGFDSKNLQPGEQFTKTVPAADTKTAPVPVQANDWQVTATAKSGSLVSGPGNLMASVETFASAKVCVFYGAVPGSLGDFVWHDLDKDGIQDSQEPPIQGVTVTVTSTYGISVPVVTGPDGTWKVENLPPAIYCAEFAVPSGWTSTIDQAGTDRSKDSNAVRTCLVINSDKNVTVDHGLISQASIGDYVWYDQDRDGIQDAGEPGVPGVVMTLKTCAGTLLTEVTTDPNGYYIFDNLAPGERYMVSIDTQYQSTFSNRGSDDDVDSDFDQTTHSAACTEPLDPGEKITSIDAGVLWSTNLLVKKEALSGTIEVSGTVGFVVTVENTGDITATSTTLIDENDVMLSRILTSSHPYTMTDEGWVIWELGDLSPHQVVEVTYTLSPDQSTPDGYSAHNRVWAVTETSESVKTDNSATADVSILNPDRIHTIHLPIICNQPPPKPDDPPVPPSPCRFVDGAVLNVQYWDRELKALVTFTRTISLYEDTGLILPAGGDTDYTKGLDLWVTGFQPNYSEGDQIRVIMYEPYYSHVKLVEGQKFHMGEGYPGDPIRIHVRVKDVQVASDGSRSTCITGTFLDGTIDP
jgi:hypothetical protein